MASIRVHHGTEGPHYDPYHFTEIEFTTSAGMTITLHSGLGEWCEMEGPGISTQRHKGDNAAKVFEDLAGISPAQAMRIWERKEHPSRCPKCRSKKLEQCSGYPGETLTLCLKCDSIVASHVNLAAIE